MDLSGVRTHAQDGILTVTLDRPKANAVDVATSQALYQAFSQLESDPQLRVAILTGGGDRFFCAGWDLKAGAAGEDAYSDYGPGGFAGITELFHRSKPIIAAVNGLALGGGFELALATDMIVAADTAKFALTEVTLGLVPDAGGLFRVPSRLPRNIANELMLTGRWMDAQEAASWGLVNRVVPAEDLLPTAQAMAASIVANAPLSIAAVMELVRETESMSVEQAYAHIHTAELPHYRRMQSSQDALEGARAFAEKRPPVWQGR